MALYCSQNNRPCGLRKVWLGPTMNEFSCGSQQQRAFISSTTSLHSNFIPQILSVIPRDTTDNLDLELCFSGATLLEKAVHRSLKQFTKSSVLHK